MATAPIAKQARAPMRKPNGIFNTSNVLKLSIIRKIPIMITIAPANIALRLPISRKDSNQVIDKSHEPSLYREKKSRDEPLIVQNRIKRGFENQLEVLP